MKALIVVLLFFTVKPAAYGQHYYNDIITTQQTNKQFILLKNNHVREVKATSYEADGTVSNDFTLEQKIAPAYNSIVTIASYPSLGQSTTTASYRNDKVAQSIDSAENIKSITTYTYNDNVLQSISIHTTDVRLNTVSGELHQWFFQNGVPVKMLLIKDNNDTTQVEFTADEQGNIGEERWTKKGRIVEKYFYYYNDQHLLTDIVRFNTKAQRLLPDFLFEYDQTGKLIQLTQVPQASANYLIWKYVYDANGLKQKELCFNKQKQPVGHIEYSYR